MHDPVSFPVQKAFYRDSHHQNTLMGKSLGDFRIGFTYSIPRKGEDTFNTRCGLLKSGANPRQAIYSYFQKTPQVKAKGNAHYKQITLSWVGGSFSDTNVY